MCFFIGFVSLRVGDGDHTMIFVGLREESTLEYCCHVCYSWLIIKFVSSFLSLSASSQNLYFKKKVIVSVAGSEDDDTGIRFCSGCHGVLYSCVLYA